MAALEALRADAKVKVFDFSFNLIAGNVPNSVFTLQPLRTVTRISLPNNQLENAGIDFRVMFTNLKFLKYLDVSNNNLSGAMDIRIDSDEDENGKQRPLLHLNLSRNRITSFTRSFFSNVVLLYNSSTRMKTTFANLWNTTSSAAKRRCT